MPSVHERILMLAESIYHQALQHFDRKEFLQAELKAAAATTPATFVSADNDVSTQLRERAWPLALAATQLMYRAQLAEKMEYGNKFLSGSKKQISIERKFDFDQFLDEIAGAVHEVNSRS